MVAEERGEYAENQREALSTLVSLAFNNPTELQKHIERRHKVRNPKAAKASPQMLGLVSLFRDAGATLIQVKH
jgi:hypothetical protein